MDVTVLIPLYNGIEFLGEAVASLVAQTDAAWTALVGVNGWPADSDVLRAARSVCTDPRVRVLDLPDARGKSAALNALVRHVTTPWVALLDADDVWLPGKLAAQRPWMESYDVVGTRCVYIGDRAGTVPWVPTGDLAGVDFFSVNPIINSSACVRTPLAHWNEDNRVGLEDYELWLTLRARRMYNVPEVLVLHRIHAASAFNGRNDAHVAALKQRMA